MKKNARISTFVLAFSVIILTGCRNESKTPAPETVEPTSEEWIRKGEYLVTIMGCHDCHSPKQVSPEGVNMITGLMLSGYPENNTLQKVDASLIKIGWGLFGLDGTVAAGPWGVSFAANITSDQTGVGSWTEENFKRALKEGKYKGLEGSRTLLPPMPWTNFANIEDQDVKAIFSYLQNTNPVRNVVPQPVSPEEIMKP